MKKIFLDFETKCKLDIDLVGTDNYARSAKVLMLGWAIENRKVQVWFPDEDEMPSELRAALLDPEFIKIAWYATFERLIFKYTLGIDIPIEQWRDAMILARHISLPGKLESVCDILKIGKDEAKIKDGKRLIKIFCEPNGEEGQETLWGVSDGFNDPRAFPTEWRLFCDYCIRDVEIERTLWEKLLKLSFPEEMWKDWFFDQHMNDAGMPFNAVRAQKALGLAARFKNEAKERLNNLTGLENANSRTQLLPWLEARGYSWGSLLKTYVDAELKNPESKLTPEAREVLILRQKSAQNSYKKIEKMLAQVAPDGRIHQQFMFMGASRTGRWSAGGVQVMNMPRPIKKVKKAKPEHIFDLIDREAYDEIMKEFDGSTLPFVSSCIRMFFEAPSDHDMIVCDLAAIEYGTVGWLARCKAIMNCLRQKHDPYLDFAPNLYPSKNYQYDWLKEQYDAGNAEIEAVRQMAKPPVLGGGYGLGGGDLAVNEFGDTVRTGLWGYALNVCGVDISKQQAHDATKVYRRINHEVVQLWADMENAFKWVLKHGKTITVGEVAWDKYDKQWVPVRDNFTGAKVTFSRVHSKNIGDIIRMQLPSGRYLHYLNARIEMETAKGNDGQPWEREVIYYDGIEHSATEAADGSISKKAMKWGKTKTYGGKLTENAVQAIARDILINGCHLAVDAGFQVFGVFHDEMATLVQQTWESPTLEDLRACMSTSPSWGPTLILDASGYIGSFYKKG